MSRAKWSTSPVAVPASTARCRRLITAAPATTTTVAREYVTGHWSCFSSSPGVTRGKGYVIQVDGDGRDQSCDIEAARHVDEAFRDEYAQYSSG